MDSLVRSTQPLPGLSLIPPLDEVVGPYRMRFARSQGDLDAICRLRFEVFNLELGEGLSESFQTGRDQDEFDAQCQHLMVIHEATGECVGTYRMQVFEEARAGAGFYSETEFDLSGLPKEVLGSSMELGRACVARAHRSRKVLFHLWRGLVNYSEWNSRRYFFGCSSLTSQDPTEGQRAYDQLLRDGHVHPDLRVMPRTGFECTPGALHPGTPDVRIPRLFATYLRYGAKVLGPPAIDRVFGTIDFLTFLDFEGVSGATLELLT